MNDDGRPPDLQTRTEGETPGIPRGLGRGEGVVGTRIRNSEFGIRNAAQPPRTDFGFANFEFRISAHPAHFDAGCWMLDSRSTHPPRRTKRNVGASFRVRQRVDPRIVAVEETQRGWRRRRPPTTKTGTLGMTGEFCHPDRGPSRPEWRDPPGSPESAGSTRHSLTSGDPSTRPSDGLPRDDRNRVHP
jgi:hypothetical protein